MTNEYPVEDDESWYSQITPIFCDENLNFTEWEPTTERLWLHVKIERAINYFETICRNELVGFLLTGETNTELFSND